MAWDSVKDPKYKKVTSQPKHVRHGRVRRVLTNEEEQETGELSMMHVSLHCLDFPDPRENGGKICRQLFFVK